MSALTDTLNALVDVFEERGLSWFVFGTLETPRPVA